MKFRPFSVLSFLSLAASLSAAPIFQIQPLSQAVCPGERAVLHANASGAPGMTLQWHKNGVPVPGASSQTLAVDLSFDDAAAGSYTCVATDRDGSKVSEVAVVRSLEDAFGSFALRQYPGPNPWCPYCPPPIVLPLGHIAPGSSSALVMGACDSVEVAFTAASQAALQSDTLPTELRCSTEGQYGALEGSVCDLEMKCAGQGSPWQIRMDCAHLAKLNGLPPGSNISIVLVAPTGQMTTIHQHGDPHEYLTVSCPQVPQTQRVGREQKSKRQGALEGESSVCSILSWDTPQTIVHRGQAHQATKLIFMFSVPPGGVFPETLSRKYLASAKTSEAKNTIGAIARVTTSGNHIPGDGELEQDDMECVDISVDEPGIHRTAMVTATGSTSVLEYELGPLHLNGLPPGEPRRRVVIRPTWGALGAVLDFDAAAVVPDPQGGPTTLVMDCDGVFPGPDGETVGSLFECRQTQETPGSSIRCTASYALADYTLEIRDRGVLRASYPCAGGPVIEVPDWLSKWVLQARPNGMAAVSAKFANTRDIRVNGQLTAGDEIIFTRENLASPAPAAPLLSALGDLSLGNDGGAGRVQLHKMRFHELKAAALGEVIVSSEKLTGKFATAGPKAPAGYARAITPTTLGHSIKTKGTGANLNRTMPAPLPPVSTVPGGPLPPVPVNVIIPQVSNYAIKTKGIAATLNRIMAPAQPLTGANLMVSMNLCDSWEAELDAVHLNGLPPGTPFLIKSKGMVTPPGGQPQTGASLGELTLVAGTATVAGNGSVEQSFACSLDFTSYHIRVKKAGAVLLDLNDQTGPACTLNRFPKKIGKLGGGTECFVLRDPKGFMVTVPGQPAPLAADEVELLLVAGPGAAPQVLKTHALFSCPAADIVLSDFQTNTKQQPGMTLEESFRQSFFAATSGSQVSPIWDDGSGKGCTEDSLLSRKGYQYYKAQSDITSMLVSGPPGSTVEMNTARALGCAFSVEPENPSSTGGASFGVSNVLKTKHDTVKNSISNVRREMAPPTGGGAPQPTGNCVYSKLSSNPNEGLQVLTWIGSGKGKETADELLSPTKKLRHMAQVTSPDFGVVCPVWPSRWGISLPSQNPLGLEISWIEFPCPAPVTINGITHTVQRVAFISAAPTDPLDTVVSMVSTTFTNTDGQPLLISNLNLPLPPTQLRMARKPSGEQTLEVSSRHADVLHSSNLALWDVAELETTWNADGSATHHLPPATPPRAFYSTGTDAEGKGWTGSVKGSGK